MSQPTEFHVIGNVMQAVVVPLQPGQELQAEPGAMLYMAGDVTMESKLSGGLLGGLKRMVAGESLFMTRFVARSAGQVAFAAPHPGQLKRLDLDGRRAWLCQRDSFLCATQGIDVSVAFTKRFGAGLFGGEGFILERLSGAGTVFIHAGGNFVEFDLVPGQQLRVDTGCIVGLQPSVNYDIEMVRGVKSALFGGEGLFFATLRGPGGIWLQSLPFSRLAGRILSASPQMGRGGREQGSLLGGLGGLLDGDNS